jgi:hypothetical protein
MSVASVQGVVFMLGWEGEYARGNAEISDERALSFFHHSTSFPGPKV